MRWLPRAIPILVGIIALDFALVFGLDAFRILASPISGLDQPAFARMIYGLGKLFKLGPDGLVMLATLFGGLYLATAVTCAMHLLSRFQALRGGQVSHDMLDAALILVVVSTIVAATPALMQGATELLIQQRLPLWLVGLAATLSMIERLPEMDDRRPAGFWERKLSRRKQDKAFVAPAVRESGMTTRWNELRSEAGMKLKVELKNGGGPYAIR